MLPYSPSGPGSGKACPLPPGKKHLSSAGVIPFNQKPGGDGKAAAPPGPNGGDGMTQTEYRITERFLPGSLQQREERLEALLAEYRRMLEERALQDDPPFTGPAVCPAEAPGAEPPFTGPPASDLPFTDQPAPASAPAEASGAKPPAAGPAEAPGSHTPAAEGRPAP